MTNPTHPDQIIAAGLVDVLADLLETSQVTGHDLRSHVFVAVTRIEATVLSADPWSGRLQIARVPHGQVLAAMPAEGSNGRHVVVAIDRDSADARSAGEEATAWALGGSGPITQAQPRLLEISDDWAGADLDGVPLWARPVLKLAGLVTAHVTFRPRVEHIGDHRAARDLRDGDSRAAVYRELAEAEARPANSRFAGEPAGAAHAYTTTKGLSDA